MSIMKGSTIYTMLGLLTFTITTFAQSPSPSTNTTLPASTVPAVPPPPPLATGEARLEECFQGLLSNQPFSRSAAASMISDVCDDLIKHSAVLSPSQHSMPSGAPFDGDSRKQGANVANASAVLYVHADYLADACPGPILQSTGQAALLTVEYAKVSKTDCMAPFLTALDGCGYLSQAKGATFWKWGGTVFKNCVAYTVDANVDTKLAPGPGY